MCTSSNRDYSLNSFQQGYVCQILLFDHNLAGSCIFFKHSFGIYTARSCVSIQWPSPSVRLQSVSKIFLFVIKSTKTPPKIIYSDYLASLILSETGRASSFKLVFFSMFCLRYTLKLCYFNQIYCSYKKINVTYNKYKWNPDYGCPCC